MFFVVSCDSTSVLLFRLFIQAANKGKLDLPGALQSAQISLLRGLIDILFLQKLLEMFFLLSHSWNAILMIIKESQSVVKTNRRLLKK